MFDRAMDERRHSKSLEIDPIKYQKQVHSSLSLSSSLSNLNLRPNFGPLLSAHWSSWLGYRVPDLASRPEPRFSRALIAKIIGRPRRASNSMDKRERARWHVPFLERRATQMLGSQAASGGHCSDLVNNNRLLDKPNEMPKPHL